MCGSPSTAFDAISPAKAPDSAIANTMMRVAFMPAYSAAVLVWFIIWRTRFGYAVRAMGFSPGAAEYAGMNATRIIVLAMALSGALAGLMASNAVLGEPHKLVLNFTGGYGFTGIAVALMGRNHPIGIVMAALLFGALTQGGTELDFEFQTITRETVLVVQGLIILFSGALYYLFAPWVARVLNLTASREASA